MQRLHPIDPKAADGKARRILDGIQNQLGMTPNLMRTLANSPAALQAYVGFGAALSGASLSGALREQIALTVAELNGCEYCLAAHAAIGRSLGLGDEAIADARRADAPDSRTSAALRFAARIVESRGWVSDEDVARVRAAGYGDAQIAEIVATVAHSTFSNYFNHVAGTEVDFPTQPALQPSREAVR